MVATAPRGALSVSPSTLAQGMLLILPLGAAIVSPEGSTGSSVALDPSEPLHASFVEELLLRPFMLEPSLLHRDLTWRVGDP